MAIPITACMIVVFLAALLQTFHAAHAALTHNRNDGAVDIYLGCGGGVNTACTSNPATSGYCVQVGIDKYGPFA